MPATWVDPVKDWVAGELVTATIGNQEWRDRMMYLKASPAFTGNVTIAGTLNVTGVTTLGAVTTGALTTGLINGQTISSAANFTGAMAIAGVLTANTQIIVKDAASLQVRVESGSELGFLGVNATGGLDIWSHGSNATDVIRFLTGTGSGTAVAQISNTGVLTAGRINSAVLQPGFLAKNTGDDSGAASYSPVSFDTEIYDEAANFASNTFTAPVTGRYLFAVSIQVQSTAAQTISCTLETSNRNYVFGSIEMTATGKTFTFTGTIIADMDASDTAFISAGSGSNFTIYGSTSGGSFFSGRLLP